jgi:hypothetical protein
MNRRISPTWNCGSKKQIFGWTFSPYILMQVYIGQIKQSLGIKFLSNCMKVLHYTWLYGIACTFVRSSNSFVGSSFHLLKNKAKCLDNSVQECPRFYQCLLQKLSVFLSQQERFKWILYAGTKMETVYYCYLKTKCACVS